MNNINNIICVTSVILDNCSVKSNNIFSSLIIEMKKNIEIVREFVETYPSNTYAISGWTPRSCQMRAGKCYNNLNAQQRANFNSIVKIFNELTK